jgi:hypothetical protein
MAHPDVSNKLKADLILGRPWVHVVARIMGVSTKSFNPYNFKVPFKKKSDEAPDFYKSREWIALRYKALTTYGKRCMCCGETEGVMQVDHIKPRSKHPELALTFSNLQVLCEPCNSGKSNTDETDWRAQEQIMNAAFKNTIN